MAVLVPPYEQDTVSDTNHRTAKSVKLTTRGAYELQELVNEALQLSIDRHSDKAVNHLRTASAHAMRPVIRTHPALEEGIDRGQLLHLEHLRKLLMHVHVELTEANRAT